MADWQKGDLALSTHNWEQRDRNGTAPDAGAVHEVVASYTDDCGTFLIFGDWPHSDWRASFFRKVTPPKADEFDREVIDLMNRKTVEA